MSTRKAALAVLISGDTAQLEKALIKAGGGLDKFGKKADHTNTKVGSSFAGMAKRAVGAGAAAVGAYASIAGAKSAVDTTTTLAKTTLALHKNLGLTVEQASRWAAVAKSRDIDTKALTQTFGILGKNIEAAKAGGDAQIKTFQDLGLTQRELKGLDFDQTIKAVSDGLGNLEPGTKRNTAAMKLFGRGWQTVVPVMRGGSDEMDKQLKLADKYGVTLKGKTVKSVEDLIAAQRENRMATMGLQVAVGQELIPALTKGVQAGSRFVAQMRDGTGAGGEFADTAKHIWTEVKPVASWLLKAGAAVGRFVEKHPEVGKLAAAVIGVGLAVKTLKFVSAATGFSDLVKAGGVAAKGLKKVLTRGGVAAGEAAAANAAEGMADRMPRSLDARQTRINSTMGKGGRAAGKAFGLAAGVAALAWFAKTDFAKEAGRKINNALPGADESAARSKWFQDASDSGMSFAEYAKRHPIPKARGGWIGMPGQRGSDVRPVLAGDGEAFLTAHQQRPVNFALAYTAAAQGGPSSLTELFSKVTTPHTQRFTSGGIVSRANRMDGMHLPYVWGGGHGGPIDKGVDCSGAVSYALGVSPRVSGAFMSFGLPGPGKPMDTKIYANPTHVFSVFNGRGWGTSKENPGGGPGWLSYNTRPGFTIRHLNDSAGAAAGVVGDPQETAETGKASLTARQERAGSRLVNALVHRDLKGVSALTRGATSLGGAIDAADTTYGQTERLFGQVVGGQAGKYGDEDLGTAAGRSARTTELGALRLLKTGQKRRMLKRRAALERAVKRYEKLIKDLEKARKKAHGAKRAKINERLKSYDDRRIELAGEAKALGSAIKDVELDIGDLDSELQDVAATPDTPIDDAGGQDAAAAATASDVLSSTLNDIDLQERAGVITPESARAQRISYLTRALGGEFGALDQRQTWDVMAQLRDAQQATTQSLDDNTQALKDVKASLDASNAIAASEVAIGLREARRAFADIVSGELGARVGPRALLPGNGELSRL